ncbi:MAG: hypothetical protein LBS32_06950 [Clostridiales Family XIII bacterium]|jgi:hypothetical protein|nr:hypothetical protein [Clostridiales Family XIII bacterium]
MKIDFSSEAFGIQRTVLQGKTDSGVSAGYARTPVALGSLQPNSSKISRIDGFVQKALATLGDGDTLTGIRADISGKADASLLPYSSEAPRIDGFEQKTPASFSTALTGIKSDISGTPVSLASLPLNPSEATGIGGSDYKAEVLATSKGGAILLPPVGAWLDSSGNIVEYTQSAPNSAEDWEQRYSAIMEFHLNDARRTYEGDSEDFSERKDAAFRNTYDTLLRELREARACSEIEDDEYQMRQEALNAIYSKFAFSNIYASGSDAASFWDGVFGTWEKWLNDVNTRQANGDFGEGDEFYNGMLLKLDDRIDASSASFTSARQLKGKLGNLVEGFYSYDTMIREKAGEDGDILANALVRNFAVMLHNAKQHILSGGSAASLTDSMLDQGCEPGTAASFRFIYGEEFERMRREVFMKNVESSHPAPDKTQEDNRKEWEDLYMSLKERVEKNGDIGDLLKNMLIHRFNFAAVNVWLSYRVNFPKGTED